MIKACICCGGCRCSEDDQSLRALIERVVAGEVVAWQNFILTARELMKVFGTRDIKRVYAMLNCIYRHLKRVLQARGFTWEEVEHGLMSLEGFFEEIAEMDTHVISARFDDESHQAETLETAEPLLA